MTTPVETPGSNPPGEPEAGSQGFNGLSAATLGRLAVMFPQVVHAELRAAGPISVGEDGSLMVHGLSELREVCRDRGIDALSATC